MAKKRKLAQTLIFNPAVELKAQRNNAVASIYDYFGRVDSLVADGVDVLFAVKGGEKKIATAMEKAIRTARVKGFQLAAQHSGKKSPLYSRRIEDAVSARGRQVGKIMQRTTKKMLGADEDSAYALSKLRAEAAVDYELRRAYFRGVKDAFTTKEGAWGKRWMLDPAHPVDDECFVGGTLVETGPFTNVFKRLHTGVFCEVVFEDGTVLTATPNHPVLTNMGWQSLHSLECGDYVADRRFIERMIEAPHDFKYAVATLDKIFELSGGTLSAHTSTAANFYGDGAGSEVYAVRSYRSLRIKLASAVQAIKEGLLGCCFGHRSFAPVYLPIASSLSCSGLLHFEGSDAVANSPRLRFGSEFIPGAQQVISGVAAATPGSSTHLFGAELLNKIKIDKCLNGDVARRVLMVRTFNASLYVYTLSAAHGCYLANGIIAKNCDDAADEGVIPFDEEFSNGYATPPSHINCLCNLGIGLLS